jgi:hypothetical protein
MVGANTNLAKSDFARLVRIGDERASAHRFLE